MNILNTFYQINTLKQNNKQIMNNESVTVVNHEFGENKRSTFHCKQLNLKVPKNDDKDLTRLSTINKRFLQTK